MRDIRGDLEDRANLLEEEIETAEAKFEKLIGQLRQEHDDQLVELTAELEAVNRLIDLETRRMSNAAPDDEIEHRRTEMERGRPVPEAEDRRSLPMSATPEMEYRRVPEAEHRRAPQMEPRRAPDAEQRRMPEAEHRRAPETEPRRAQEMEPRRAQEMEPRRAPAADDRRQPEMEHRRAPDEDRGPAPEAEQRRPVSMRPAPKAQARPRQPLADFLIRTLSEVGTVSRDDLCHFVLREGYFEDAESTVRAVHTTLVNLAKADRLQQLPSGNFAPASLSQTLRLRRAM